MSRFRLFGRPPESDPAIPAAGGRPSTSTPPGGSPHTVVVARSAAGPARTGGYPSGSDGTGAGPPPFGGGAPVRPESPAGGLPVRAGGLATRSACPVAAAARRYPGDPPTDPFGYPPVAGPPPGSRAGTAPGSAGRAPSPDRAEASALAGAFAVDYLSWDEDDPARRGRVLRDYLPLGADDPARLGWSGTGRQRAEFVLPGRVSPDGEGRLLVDVRVRVTPYRPVADRVPAPEPDRQPAVAGIPAVAPAPTGPGWRGLASYWVRLTVPVVLDGGRLLVDAWEELLGADQPPAPRAPAGCPAHRATEDDREDHALADDEPEPSGVAR